MAIDNASIIDTVPDFNKERYSFGEPEISPVDNKIGSDSHQELALYILLQPRL